MKVLGVILAAGQGSRMGRNKALLPLGGQSFLACCAATLEQAGVAGVIAVLGHEAQRILREVEAPGVEFVINEQHRSGMLTSVLSGLDAAEAHAAEAVLLLPVDHPLVTPRTARRVVKELESGARIAVPSHGGRRGHPGGFAAGAWPALRAAPADRGARAVLARHPEWIAYVEGDAACLTGINTPQDYERAIGPLSP